MTMLLYVMRWDFCGEDLSLIRHSLHIYTHKLSKQWIYIVYLIRKYFSGWMCYVCTYNKLEGNWYSNSKANMFFYDTRVRFADVSSNFSSFLVPCLPRYFSPFQTMGYLRRADPEQLRAVFEKYASANVNGVPYMTDEDFVVKFLQLFPNSDFNKHSVKLLCGILDQSKDG